MPGNYLGKKQQETSGDSREDERTSKPQWICLGEMKKRIFPELSYGDQWDSGIVPVTRIYLLQWLVKLCVYTNWPADAIMQDIIDKFFLSVAHWNH